MNNAKFVENEIPVEYSIRRDVNREFLTFSIDGWENVEKISRKVLKFEDKKFIFSGWNSDENKCYFYRFLDRDPDVAKICS